MTYIKLKKLIAKFLFSPINEILVEVTLYSFALYATTKKFVAFSGTQIIHEQANLLLNTKIADSIAENIIFCISIFLVYCALAKIALIASSKIPWRIPTKLDLSNISLGIQTIRNEDEFDLKLLEDKSKTAYDLATLREERTDVCATTIVGLIVADLKKCLPKLENDDVFVSLYVVDVDENINLTKPRELIHLTHEPNRNIGEICSYRIPLIGESHKEYECVKCITDPNSSDAIRVVADCRNNYYKSRSSRLDHIRHYIGIKLTHKNNLLGFINIELSNNAYFSDEKELRKFVGKNILGYKYMLEHHLLRDHIARILKGRSE